MFQPDDPTAEADFQIDPVRSPYFQIMQKEAELWVEVGFVWTSGTSRTNSIENWYLYDSVAPGDRTRRAYEWPGYNRLGRLLGTKLRLVPATPPTGVTVSELKVYLERNNQVTLTHVKGVVTPGS